jgi:hypothetical protein
MWYKVQGIDEATDKARTTVVEADTAGDALAAGRLRLATDLVCRHVG